MARLEVTLGVLALVLLSSISSSCAEPASLRPARAAARLLQSDDDMVFPARVPAACDPSTTSSSFTKTGCGAGCQSCRLQKPPTGARDCVCCKPGFVPSKISNATCTACRVGTTARFAGSTRCTNCTRGLTTSKAAATTCNACPPGRQLVPGLPLPSCKVCPAGSVSAGGLLTAKPTCTACPGNTTTLRANRVKCNGCKAGYGGPSCAMCKLGYWSAGGAATNASACRACPAGMFTLGEGAPARAACLSTTIPTNTTIPLNLTSLMLFTLENATCDSVWTDALIATFNEEKQKAAASDKLVFNFTTTLVNCTEVPRNSSGRRLSQFDAALLAFISTQTSGVSFGSGSSASNLLSLVILAGGYGVPGLGGGLGPPGGFGGLGGASGCHNDATTASAGFCGYGGYGSYSSLGSYGAYGAYGGYGALGGYTGALFGQQADLSAGSSILARQLLTGAPFPSYIGGAGDSLI